MNDELRALFIAKCLGTITPEQHAELERRLAASAEVRRLWFEHCDLEMGLADWAAAQSAKREHSPDRSHPSHFPLRWLAPLAAAAAIALAALWWPRSTTTPQPTETAANGVALLTRAVGVEWDGPAPTSGGVLETGTLRLRSGAALVEFFSGARVIVEGPAEFELVSANEAALRTGKLSAHVPPQARGFTVHSEGLTIVDRGTDFGVTVARDAAPEVHVFTGKVEVAAAALAPRALQTGEAARLDHGQWQSIAAARDAFLTEPELIRRDATHAGQRLAAWRESNRALSAETALHFTFDEDAASPARIFNHTPNAPDNAHGSIIGATWTDGRWPGKRALQFRSQGDRIRFSAPQPMKAVTLLTWVRVDSLPRGQNVLLSADAEETGAVHWLLTNRGELRLEIARDLGRPHADWEAVNSTPFVTPDRIGQWLLLATTFDGKTIRHFGNGEIIGSGASFTPPSLIIGTAELGNWRGATQRHLAAAMDELVVLSRAMGDEEIRRNYESGRP